MKRPMRKTTRKKTVSMGVSNVGEALVLPIKMIFIEKGHNPRTNTVPDKGLLKSIEAKGVIRPITVREKDGKIYVVDGERRLRAARTIGLDEIPVLHKGEISDEVAFLASVILNRNQRKLIPPEMFVACKKFISQGLSRKEIANLLGESENKVRELLRIEKKGTKRMKSAVKKGKIGTRAASQAVDLPEVQQDDIVADLSDKPEKEAINTVSMRKNLIGGKLAKHRTKDKNIVREDLSLPFKIAKDAAERCKRLEILISRRMEARRGKVEMKIMLSVLDVIRGDRTPDSLF